ncbi:alpha/beta fold hydrolase [Gordonia desulfuricans]|uniref:Alpha/beta fold hydrolase n=1 Tax=Gordonia desulfuricans TaxID=89051 RepID=A0A7K3LU91_9ACTN|nr:alpha/beta fold hydrolase [Gordonia desulfuricans]NDK91812.1 alpha/beta fold hydrolase [Gordonia desulfuricans]
MRLVGRPTESGDLTLAVRTSGTPGAAPPVLLVHGMGGDHSTWRYFAGQLRAAGRAVLAVDLRGHGRSGRPGDYRLESFSDDLRYVLDDLDVAQVDVVGHSLGAHASLRLAMSAPDRVRSLVLEEVPPMPRDQADVDEGIVMDSSLGERVRGLALLLANPMPLLRFDRAVGGQVGAAFEQAEPQWWQRLAQVSARTLVISGGQRSFLPSQHLRTLAETIPGARFEVIEAGHSVHRDRRREFCGAAGGFLTQA